MLEQGGGGAIVNVTSIDALHPTSKGMSHYTTSKHALWGLTKCLALELGPGRHPHERRRAGPVADRGRDRVHPGRRPRGHRHRGAVGDGGAARPDAPVGRPRRDRPRRSSSSPPISPLMSTARRSSSTAATCSARSRTALPSRIQPAAASSWLREETAPRPRATRSADRSAVSCESYGERYPPANQIPSRPCSSLMPSCACSVARRREHVPEPGVVQHLRRLGSMSRPALPELGCGLGWRARDHRRQPHRRLAERIWTSQFRNERPYWSPGAYTPSVWRTSRASWNSIRSRTRRCGVAAGSVPSS